MRIDVVSLFPDMIEQMSQYGIFGRAIAKGLCTVNCWNPRDFTDDKYKTVDDRPYGGGPGMVMLAEPLSKAIRAAKQSAGSNAKVVYLTPQGEKLTQAKIELESIELKSKEISLVLVCGRYEGIDQRVIDLNVDEQWSIGDYVLAGGELPALVVMESIIRMLPGALGNIESSNQDSFSDGLLDFEHYTRPESYGGVTVPAVLLSGNHEQIARWRLKQSLGRTYRYRPDLLESKCLTKQEKLLLDEYKQETGDQ